MNITLKSACAKDFHLNCQDLDHLFTEHYLEQQVDLLRLNLLQLTFLK
jgi:hypothetical protein